MRSARAAVAVQRESEGGAMDEDGDGDEEDNGGWRAVVIAELAEVFQRFPSPVSLFDHEMQRPLAEEELKDRALSWPVTSFFQVVNDFQMEVAVDWKEDSSSIHSSFAVLASRFRSERATGGAHAARGQNREDGARPAGRRLGVARARWSRSAVSSGERGGVRHLRRRYVSKHSHLM